MARKKKNVPAVQPSVEPPPTLTIPELELLRLTRAEAEIRAAKAELANIRNVKETLVQKIDPKGLLRQLDAKINEAFGKVNEFQKEYEQHRDLIGTKLGIDMKNYSFDDRTGVLHDISDLKS